jgi:hypothetical protein
MFSVTIPYKLKQSVLINCLVGKSLQFYMITVTKKTQTYSILASSQLSYQTQLVKLVYINCFKNARK